MKRFLSTIAILAIPAMTVLLLTINSIGAVFPAATATDATLLVARNSATTTLNGSINASVTTFVLTSGTRFGADMAVTIDGEIITCTTLTTNTFSGCTRGAYSTTAASHSNGATVNGYLIAAHHNALADEIKAIEGTLRGTAPSGVLTLTLKAGATQGSQPMLEFRNNAGTLLAEIDSGMAFATFATGAQKMNLGNKPVFSSDVVATWRDNADLTLGSDDTGLGRGGPGIVEINNGTAGTYRDLILRSQIFTTQSEATCDSTIRGKLNFVAGSAGVADTVRICVKDSSNNYHWTPIF